MNPYPYLGAGIPFDPNHNHVTSPLVSPHILSKLRLLLAVYTLVTLITTLAWESVVNHVADGYFSYFTHLSYLGLCAYFFAAGVQTLASSRRAASYPLQKWPRPLQVLHLLLQTTITTYPIVVTAVFWALLASPTVFSTVESSWSNISVHILNLVFAVFEIFFTNIPPAPWLMLPLSIMLLACYLALAYVTYAAQGFYPYTFLDPVKQGPLLAAYIIGILGGYIIIFLLVRFLILMRIRVVRWHRARKGEKAMGAEAIEDWEEIERPSKEGGAVV
ncbi:hypothetical protein DXG01_006858 [Tephrocybe rancida]|nr:hypothetical protein DXG01_006858 [Tephrocybe rancida]